MGKSYRELNLSPTIKKIFFFLLITVFWKGNGLFRERGEFPVKNSAEGILAWMVPSCADIFWKALDFGKKAGSMQEQNKFSQELEGDLRHWKCKHEV